MTLDWSGAYLSVSPAICLSISLSYVGPFQQVTFVSWNTLVCKTGSKISVIVDLYVYVKKGPYVGMLILHFLFYRVGSGEGENIPQHFWTLETFTCWYVKTMGRLCYWNSCPRQSACWLLLTHWICSDCHSYLLTDQMAHWRYNEVC